MGFDTIEINLVVTLIEQHFRKVCNICMIFVLFIHNTGSIFGWYLNSNCTIHNLTYLSLRQKLYKISVILVQYLHNVCNLFA